jgi:hypothetical protein
MITGTHSIPNNMELRKSKPMPGRGEFDAGISVVLDKPGKGVITLADGRKLKQLSVTELCEGPQCLHLNSAGLNSKELYEVFRLNPSLQWARDLYEHLGRYAHKGEVPDPYPSDPNHRWRCMLK